MKRHQIHERSKKRFLKPSCSATFFKSTFYCRCYQLHPPNSQPSFSFSFSCSISFCCTIRNFLWILKLSFFFTFAGTPLYCFKKSRKVYWIVSDQWSQNVIVFFFIDKWKLMCFFFARMIRHDSWHWSKEFCSHWIGGWCKNEKCWFFSEVWVWCER